MHHEQFLYRAQEGRCSQCGYQHNRPDWNSWNQNQPRRYGCQWDDRRCDRYSWDRQYDWDWNQNGRRYRYERDYAPPQQQPITFVCNCNGGSVGATGGTGTVPVWFDVAANNTNITEQGVQFDFVNRNIGGAVSSTTPYRVTIPQTGTYQIRVGARYTCVSPGFTINLQLVKVSGGTPAVIATITPNTQNNTASLDQAFSLQAGDELQLRVGISTNMCTLTSGTWMEGKMTR